ncbi:TRAP transporter large permease subunit, partial [Acinetobacter baumannii]
AVSGTLAMLIPPSVALIIFGLLAELSVGKLLVGGIIPCVVVTITIMATVWVLAVRNPQDAPCSPRVSFLTRLKLLHSVGPMLLL